MKSQDWNQIVFKMILFEFNLNLRYIIKCWFKQNMIPIYNRFRVFETKIKNKPSRENKHVCNLTL